MNPPSSALGIDLGPAPAAARTDAPATDAPAFRPGMDTNRFSGRAKLRVEVVHGQSAVVSLWASNPLKLLAPHSRGRSVWAYTSNLGGGLVAGDQTRIDVRIGRGARCFVGTQASTKVYRNPEGLPCGHTTHAVVEDDALLVFAPEPVQAFAEAIYTQRQEFRLAPNAGLVLVDWYTAGRTACGERWAFRRLHSRNEVWRKAEEHDLVLLDSLRLDPSEQGIAPTHPTGRYNCFGMLLLLGPPAREMAARLLKGISTRPVLRRDSVVCSASPVRDGAIFRIAGETVEHVGLELHRHLIQVRDLLGDDPWARR